MFRAGQPARTAIERFEKLFTEATKKNVLIPKDVEEAFAVEPMSDSFFDGTIGKKNGLGKEEKSKDFAHWENKYKKEKTRNKFGYVQWYLLFTSYVIANKNNPDAFGDYFKSCDDKIIRDYVKKLFGRIVFLFFLQRKGWMGCPADSDKWENGDPRFMQNLFKNASEAQKDDYLDGILEPLFFNCLNAPRPRDVYDTRVAAIGEVRIPYLNGGLFERDENIDPPKSKFPADYFKYLFEFFDRYNFTIDENDADDAEIGVDPEMLGRIFENLLEDNKKKGAYYTRKEIVSYMCKESLIAYLNKDNRYDAAALRHFVENHDFENAEVLNTDECKDELLNKLIAVKICDPAIGSGAFPMGLLQELKKCREALGEQNPSKADIIQNNIYGVDIEAGAVDIARLRFWLSLLVDADEPKPLPNLNYKIMQGNSLLESYQIHDLSRISDDKEETKDTKPTRKRKQLDLYVDNKNFQKSDKADTMNWPVALCNHHLQVSVNEYNSATDLALRHKLKRDILKNAFDLYETAAEDKTREQIMAFLKQSIESIDLSTATSVYYYFTEHQLRQMLKDKINLLVRKLLKERANLELKDIDPSGNANFFLWHTWFKEVFDKGGFDIVIGNPPYIKEYENKSAFNGFRERSPYYFGKMDIWYGFACHGIDLLKANGIICLIAQNNWTTNSGAVKLRTKVANDVQILQMIDFNTYYIFDTADIQTMVMLFKRDSVIDDYCFDYRTITRNNETEDMNAVLSKLITKEDGKTKYNTKYLSPQVSRHTLKDKLFTFSENKKEQLLDAIANDSETLKKVYFEKKEITQGITPNPDVVNKDNIKLLDDTKSKLGDGVFVVDKTFFQNISENEKKYIKPTYEPNELDRYVIKDNSKSILYITSSNWKDDAPTLKEHLRKYKPIMDARRENVSGSREFMHLHWPKNEKFFISTPKILAVRKCTDYPIFVYCEKESYVMLSINVIQTNRWNMKFLTGLLNSRLVEFWLKLKGKMQGNVYQIDEKPLLSIPLPDPDNIPSEIEKSIVELVESIIKLKSQQPITNKQIDDIEKQINDIEEQINNFVYKLYDIDADGQTIIESEFESEKNSTKKANNNKFANHSKDA